MESEVVLPFSQKGATAAYLGLHEFSVQSTTMFSKTYLDMLHICALLTNGAFRFFDHISVSICAVSHAS
jgi:hypothetical protein